MSFTDKFYIHIRKAALQLGVTNRKLPHTLIIGAQKSGTSSLFNYLNRHSREFVEPWRKEIHYFDHHYQKSRAWYKAHFPKRDEGKTVTGEATPYYIFHPDVPRRVYKLIPDVRLIVILRDPLKRAWSHYNFQNRTNRSRASNDLSFREAIAKEADILAGEHEKLVQDPGYYSYKHQYYSYISRGIYHRQLSRWLQYFSRDQLYVTFFQDFFDDPQHELPKLIDFLDLTMTEEPVENRQLNQTSYPDMPEDLYDELRKFYHPHNLELEKLLGVDTPWT